MNNEKKLLDLRNNPNIGEVSTQLFELIKYPESFAEAITLIINLDDDVIGRSRPIIKNIITPNKNTEQEFFEKKSVLKNHQAETYKYINTFNFLYEKIDKEIKTNSSLDLKMKECFNLSLNLIQQKSLYLRSHQSDLKTVFSALNRFTPKFKDPNIQDSPITKLRDKYNQVVDTIKSKLRN